MQVWDASRLGKTGGEVFVLNPRRRVPDGPGAALADDARTALRMANAPASGIGREGRSGAACAQSVHVSISIMAPPPVSRWAWDLSPRLGIEPRRGGSRGDAAVAAAESATPGGGSFETGPRANNVALTG